MKIERIAQGETLQNGDSKQSQHRRSTPKTHLVYFIFLLLEFLMLIFRVIAEKTNSNFAMSSEDKDVPQNTQDLTIFVQNLLQQMVIFLTL
jgi:ABC-type transport system involved in multi-copper enzyme maturation permease subunit